MATPISILLLGMSFYNVTQKKYTYKHITLKIDNNACSLHVQFNIINTNLKIQIDTNEIELVDSFCFLGIIIEANLNWNSRINAVCKKVSKNIGAIRKVSYFLPKECLRTLIIFNTCLSILLLWQHYMGSQLSNQFWQTCFLT